MRVIPSVLLLVLLCGCASDPFQRPQTWRLPPDGQGANDANLRTMLVNPADLTAGTSDDTSVGRLSVRPVDALLSGHRQPLPAGNASTIGASSLQSGGQGLGGAGTPSAGGMQ